MPDNPIHASSFAGKVSPGGKKWRKMLKIMLDRLKEQKEDSNRRVVEGLLTQQECDRSDTQINIEIRLMIYAYHMDTRNAILEMKNFKVLCQEKSAAILGIAQYELVVVNTNGVAKTLTGDEAYKTKMERCGDDIKFYEKICRALVSYDCFADK